MLHATTQKVVVAPHAFESNIGVGFSNIRAYRQGNFTYVVIHRPSDGITQTFRLVRSRWASGSLGTKVYDANWTQNPPWDVVEIVNDGMRR